MSDEKYTRRCPECGAASDEQWTMLTKETVLYAITGMCDRGYLNATETIEHQGGSTLEYQCTECAHGVKPDDWRDLEIVRLNGDEKA